MKKILLFSLLLHLCLVIHAQTPADEALSRMNYVFEEVNRSNVPTGLLSNYGVQPIPLEYYNGIPADSNFVDNDSYILLIQAPLIPYCMARPLLLHLDPGHRNKRLS